MVSLMTEIIPLSKFCPKFDGRHVSTNNKLTHIHTIN